MGKGSWMGGIEGNSARLQKVYLAKTELLSCKILCPAADFTLVFCISHGAFLLVFHGEKVLL